VIQRMLLLPYTFVLLNWAAVRGLLCYLRRGGLDGVWSDTRRHRADGRQRPAIHPSEP